MNTLIGRAFRLLRKLCTSEELIYPSEVGLSDLSHIQIFVQPAPAQTSLNTTLSSEALYLHDQTVKLIRADNLAAIASVTFGSD